MKNCLKKKRYSAFFNNLRSAINNFLSFFQAKTSYFTDNLDNLNLVRTNLCQLNVVCTAYSRPPIDMVTSLVSTPRSCTAVTATCGSSRW